MTMTLILLILLSLSFGSVLIDAATLWKGLVGNLTETEATYHILYNFRLPKTITTIFAGAALAFAGLQMQTLFRNPLAGPFVLGISSGASLGVALLVLTGIGFTTLFASWSIAIASITGSSLVLLLIIFISFRIKDSMSLLLIGLMFGAFTSAIVGILQYFSNPQDIQNFLFWTFGSTGALGWIELKVFVPTILIGLILGAFQVKPLNALLMGEQYAQSMGLNVLKSRIALVLSTSILAGVVTAFCGPVAFIGLAVPHFSRMIHQTSNHQVLIPSVLLTGASTLLLCDIIAQLPGLEIILPINAVTSIFGAPIVIWLIVKRKNLTRNFG
jgi:iron complex transport system permease protein